MKSIFNFFALGLLCLSLSAPTFAQKNKSKIIEEAHVQYTVTADGGMAAVLTGSKVDLFFTADHAKIVGDVMSGLVKLDGRFDHKKKTGLLLLDMMGEKQYMELDDESIEKSADESEVINQKPPKIEYIQKYKDIAGYKCQEVRMTLEESPNPIIIYVTEQIKPSNLENTAIMKFAGLKGFPLAWEGDYEGVKFSVKATDVFLDRLSKKIFSSKVPDGYTKMTGEELQNMGGTIGL
ncbi:MAG: Unknown protein [uncultured Aureispira sp.]|uniref:DUF4412 domain-containing protein n=1 Tax=uncultured Aureispira sp. TaxID=1331704 RepID=A0A6S6TBZ3_9BACT|nr:MAG: Unknown protein [uncultured Aureispira sp.]